MNLSKAEFKLSAASPGDFVRDGLPQIVFAGRSNVGKSSVINCLLNHKNYARVGAAPGKTAHINYFLIDGSAYFVDLPGYGYAKVSAAEKARWGRLLERYFSESGLITAGVLIVDARHRPTGDDVTMAGWFYEVGCPLVAVANKADKINKSELAASMDVIRETLGLRDNDTLISFSAEKRTNRDLLASEIAKLAFGDDIK